MTKGFAAALLGLSLVSASPGLAAVSGFYDSGAQIKVLLDSSELGDLLRQLPITDLEFDRANSDGLLKWKVDSQECDVDVWLKPIPPAAMVGPTRYEIAEIGRCD